MNKDSRIYEAVKQELKRDPVYTKATADYLASIDRDNPPTLATAAGELSRMTSARAKALDEWGAWGDAGGKRPVPDMLPAEQIADLITALRDVVTVNDAVFGYSLVAIYEPGGPDGGIYSADILLLRDIVGEMTGRRHVDWATLCDVERFMSCNALLMGRFRKPRLVAGNNGILDCRTKKVVPFPPEYAFLDRRHTDMFNYMVYKDLGYDEEMGVNVERWMSWASLK